MSHYYFRPGRVILHVQHHRDIKPTTLRQMVRDYLKGDAGPAWGGRVGMAELPTEAQEAETVRSLTDLPDATGKILSLVCVESESPLEVTQAAHQSQVNEAGLPLPKAITIDTIKLLSAAPDWLTGSSHHQGMTGGPGDWPSPASAAVGDWKVHFADELLPAWEQRGEGVDVAILDTAPSAHARIWAWHECTQHPNKAHPILETLLAPDHERLKVYPMSEAAMWQIPYSVSDHHYRMSDHGLFVAGLIYATAPKATLHLYEVLNTYGVGSWETVAYGLERALRNRRAGRPLIVNASLMFGFPRPEYADNEFPLAGQPEVLDYSTEPLRLAFEWLLRDPNVVMVAAAGNDSNGTRLPARYPAAFGNVIGVAAMGRDAQPNPAGQYPAASYSNYADKPICDGYMTLGGERGAGNGLLGPYLDDMPQRNPSGGPVDYAPNTTGWARWAGTSFATPIVSGLVAAWWGQAANRTQPGAAAKEALHTLATRVPDKSVNDEEVIHVRQGN